MIWSARQRQSAIAMYDLDTDAAVLGVLQEGEIAPRNRLHGRIDFIEGPILILLRVTSQGTGAQTEHRHAPLGGSLG